MAWERIGGNPAPGDPQTIIKVGVNECRRISDAAAEAFSGLKAIGDGLGSAVWQGPAADIFGTRLPDTLEDLRRVQGSYSDVGDALNVYAVKLTSGQEDARITLRKATDAQERAARYRKSLKRYVAIRDDLGRQVSDLEGSIGYREWQLAELTRERLIFEQRARSSVDPAEQASLEASATTLAVEAGQAAAARDSLTRQMRQVSARLLGVQDDVNRAARARDDAEKDDQVARKMADAVREEMKRAGDTAAEAVRAAKASAIGNSWDRFRHRVRESKAFKVVAAFVDDFAEDLGKLSLVLAAVVMFIPGLNAVFALAIAIVAAVSAIVAVAGFALKAFAGRSTGLGLLFSGLSAGFAMVGASSAVRAARGIAAPAASAKGADNLLTRVKMIVRGKTGQIRQNLNLTYFKTTVGGSLYKGYAEDITSLGIVKSAVLPGGVKPSQVFNSIFTRAGTETLAHAGEVVVDKTGGYVDAANETYNRPREVTTIADVRARIRAILLAPDQGAVYAY